MEEQAIGTMHLKTQVFVYASRGRLSCIDATLAESEVAPDSSGMGTVRLRSILQFPRVAW